MPREMARKKGYFLPKLLERRFFPFERRPFLCLELSDVERELERLKESDAWREKDIESPHQRSYVQFTSNNLSSD